jgi:hypothetical protein
MTRGNRILATLLVLGLLTAGLGGAVQAQAGGSKTFTISGFVGVDGVEMIGLPGKVVTDKNGAYSARVPRGWSGRVTPTKPGYVFEPYAREYEPISESFTEENFTARRVPFVISGTVGLAGVTFQGFPSGRVVTDENGMYRAEVSEGWSGKATPVKLGYVFYPPSRTYQAVGESLASQDYTSALITFRISGTTGLPGVRMTGLPGEVVTNPSGDYSVTVPYRWSGTVVPEKEGYRFEPPTKTYTPLERNMTNESYAATVVTFTISGRTGVAGVLMKGLPREPVTDQEGFYKAQVPFGWSGVVRPSKEGLSFTPPERTYDSVTESLSDENYAVGERMVTISDVIKAGNEPIQGVTVSARPGDHTALTDGQGRYSLRVPRGWSGSLTFSKPGFDFVGGREYRNVTADITDGKSVPAEDEWPPDPSGGSRGGVSVPAGKVLVIPTSDTSPEKIAETTEDLRVMLQILREKLSEPRMIRGVLRDYGSLLGDDRRAEAIYLQGSAALFVIGADFPPSSAAQQRSEGEPQSRSQGEAADPVWQRARQRLYSPGARSPSPSGQAQTMTFEQFQEELLRSLRHAANIRHIDPNERVVLTLVAQNEGASRAADADMMRQYQNIYGNDDHMTTMGLGRPARSTTALTMQARKADIDAFAQGALDFDQFRRKVKSLIY